MIFSVLLDKYAHLICAESILFVYLLINMEVL